MPRQADLQLTPNSPYRLVIHFPKTASGKIEMTDNAENPIFEHLRAIRADKCRSDLVMVEFAWREIQRMLLEVAGQ